MTSKDIFAEKTRAQIKAWGIQIEKLAATARNAPASEKAEYSRFVENARSRRKVVQKMLHDGEALSGEAWEAMLICILGAMKDVQLACDIAVREMEPTAVYPVAALLNQLGKSNEHAAQ
jgi:hypothetical protein